MIDIKLTKYGPLHRVEANGHAEYNPGNDIVCAGIGDKLSAKSEYQMIVHPDLIIEQQ